MRVVLMLADGSEFPVDVLAWGMFVRRMVMTGVFMITVVVAFVVMAAMVVGRMLVYRVTHRLASLGVLVAK